MEGKKISTLLTLGALIFVFFCSPAFAADTDGCDADRVLYNGECLKDKDGDGVPDKVEDAGPNLFGTHSDMSDVATFTAADGRYMTLLTGDLVGLPGLALRNVGAIDTPDEKPFPKQAVQTVPFGFITFDLMGTERYSKEYEDYNFTVTLILHDYYPGDVSDVDLVRYGSTSCPTDFSKPGYYLPGIPFDIFSGVGIFVNIFLTDGEPGNPDCAPTGTIPFIGAPALAGEIDVDEDDVLVFEDNCPDTYNPDQEDADKDGMGDVCDFCPADPDNDIDGDGVCGDVDNCPAVSNFKQLDANFNGTGDVCDVEDETTVYSYIGKRFWRFFRDYDVWEFYAKAGQSVQVTVQADPVGDGSGKSLILVLFGKTRGARLLRIDRSALDPENKVEAQIPKDGWYGIVVGQSFWRSYDKKYGGIYRLTIKGDPEILDSLRATRSVGKWWR